MADHPFSTVGSSAGSLSETNNETVSDGQRSPSRPRSSLKIADLVNDYSEPAQSHDRAANRGPGFPDYGGTWPMTRLSEDAPSIFQAFHSRFSFPGGPSGQSDMPPTQFSPPRSRSADMNSSILFSRLSPPTVSRQIRLGRSRRSSTSTQSTVSSFAMSHGGEPASPPSPATARERRESRPAYQKEEDIFIWYHRDDLGLQWNEISKRYNEQFPNRPRIGRQGIQSRYYRILEAEEIPKIRKRPKPGKSRRIREHYGVIARTDRRYSWMKGVEGPSSWRQQVSSFFSPQASL